MYFSELTKPLQCTSGKPVPNTKCAGVQNLPCPRHHYCVTPDTWAKELGVCCPSTRLLHRTYIDPADIPTNTQSSATPNDGFSSKSKLLKDTYSFELKQLTDAYYSRWKQLSEAYASGLNQTTDSQSNNHKPLTGGFASKTSKPKPPNDVFIKRGRFSTSPKRSNTNFLSQLKQTSDTSSSKPVVSTSTYSPKSSLTKSNFLSKWKQTRDAYSSKPSLNNDSSKLKSTNTNYLSKWKQTSGAYSSKANLNNDPAKLKSTNTNYLSKWKQTSGSYSSKRSGSNDAYFAKPKLKGGGRSLPPVRSSGGSPLKPKPKQINDVHSAKQNQAPDVHFPKKPNRKNVGHSSKPKQTHAIHFPKPKPVSGAFLSNKKQATKDLSSLSSPVAVRFSSLPQPSAEPYLPKKVNRWSSKTMPDFLTGKDVVFLDKKKQSKKAQTPSIKLLGNQQEQNAGGLAAQLGLGLTSRVDNTKSRSPQLSIDLPPRVDKTTSLFQMFVHQLLEKALTNTKHSQQHSQTERPKMAQQKSLKILTLNDNPQNKLTNGRKEELIHKKVAYDISTTDHKPQKKVQNKGKNIKQKGEQTKQSTKQATKSNSAGRKVPKPKAEKQQSKGKSNKGKPKAQTQKPKGNKGTKAQKGRAADPREVEAEERVPNPGQTTTTTTAAPTAPTTAGDYNKYPFCSSCKYIHAIISRMH